MYHNLHMESYVMCWLQETSFEKQRINSIVQYWIKRSIAQTSKEIVVGVGVEMTVNTKEQLERVTLGKYWTNYEWLVGRVVRVVL